MINAPTSPRILLLGGIGTGKSAVARLLAELGATVVDADRLGHQVLDDEGFEAVADRWPSVITSEGTVDRRALGAIVFRDRDELAALEGITHPLIAARIAKSAAEVVDRPLVVEMPLLKNLTDGAWIRVAVTAPRDVRMERLAERGMTKRDIVARMDAQPSDAEFVQAADHVIDNSGSLDDLGRQVLRLWSILVAA
ncbi:MAG: dephospho-CoA kinase [Acidimicrobiia bacterium]|nr:dephospho-CoA kinase [Acidimicrobiia bacterium]